MKATSHADVTTLRHCDGNVTAETRVVACVTAFSMRAHMHFIFMFFSNIDFIKEYSNFSILFKNCRHSVTHLLINNLLCHIAVTVS